MSAFTKDTPVMGLPAGKISGVVDAEGSVFAKDCYEALLAIAQTMRDMTESGRFGSSLEKVLKVHFCKGNESYHPRCLDAVEDVFVKGILRNPDWKIYQFRSYAKYSVGQGQPDTEKLSPLFEKYQYLGKDGISDRWGHFYFGKIRIYRVQIGAYRLRSNAQRLYARMKEEGIDCIISSSGGVYRVQAAAFFSKENAENYKNTLKKKGFSDAFVGSGF